MPGKPTQFSSFPELFMYLLTMEVEYIVIGESHSDHGAKYALQNLFSRTSLREKLIVLTEAMFGLKRKNFFSTKKTPYKVEDLNSQDAEYDFYKKLILLGVKLYGAEDEASNPFFHAKTRAEVLSVARKIDDSKYMERMETYYHERDFDDVGYRDLAMMGYGGTDQRIRVTNTSFASGLYDAVRDNKSYIGVLLCGQAHAVSLNNPEGGKLVAAGVKEILINKGIAARKIVTISIQTGVPESVFSEYPYVEHDAKYEGTFDYHCKVMRFEGFR